MAAGKPIIVFDHGWYAELPDEACVKVPPLDEQALYSAMRQLAQDPAARSSLGELARQTTRQDHDPGIVADAYVDFLEDCLDHIHQNKLDYQK
jgi:glycosyltransferase involved in cell wall biosynthesis